MNHDAPTPELTVVECEYCHNTFFAQVGKRAKYCSDSHKEMAYRQRRAATVAALMGDLGDDAQEAADKIDRMGLRTCNAYLLGKGYVYDSQAARWGLPVESARVFVRSAGKGE